MTRLSPGELVLVNSQYRTITHKELLDARVVDFKYVELLPNTTGVIIAALQPASGYEEHDDLLILFDNGEIGYVLFMCEWKNLTRIV